jgi:hypothetical protein
MTWLRPPATLTSGRRPAFTTVTDWKPPAGLPVRGPPIAPKTKVERSRRVALVALALASLALALALVPLAPLMRHCCPRGLIGPNGRAWP